MASSRNWYKGVPVHGRDHEPLTPIAAEADVVGFDAYTLNTDPVFDMGDLVHVLNYSDEKIFVSPIDITDKSRMPAVGIITKRYSTNFYRVASMGVVTIASGTLEPGNRYFAGRDGRVQLYSPMPSLGETVYVQEVGYSLSDKSMIFNPSLKPTGRVG